MQVIRGARMCLDQKLQHPCLILIYTLIDSLAWASSDKSSGTVRSRFEQWVVAWLGSSIPCTATELYAARCAVLHTLTSKADLTKSGKAREIAYAWGIAKVSDLQTAITRAGQTNLVAVHIDQLLDAICVAMGRMLEETQRNPALERHLQDAAKQHFVTDGPHLIKEFLEKSRDA